MSLLSEDTNNSSTGSPFYMAKYFLFQISSRSSSATYLSLSTVQSAPLSKFASAILSYAERKMLLFSSASHLESSTKPFHYSPKFLFLATWMKISEKQSW